MLVDSLVLANIHPRRPSGHQRPEQRGQAPGGGTLKPGALRPASGRRSGGESLTVAGAGAWPSGIGGKCHMVVAGDVSGRQQRGYGSQRKRGAKALVYRSVIPRPHEAMWRQMVEG